jgi:hypothetical protein
VKKKGEAFGGSQKKTARINFNNPTSIVLFGKQLRQNIQRFWVNIFFLGGEHRALRRWVGTSICAI